VDERVETVFLPAVPELSYINSTVVREMLLYKKSIDKYVPPEVAEYIRSICTF